MQKIEFIFNIVHYCIFKAYRLKDIPVADIVSPSIPSQEIKHSRSVSFIFILNILNGFSFFCILTALHRNFLPYSDGFILLLSILSIILTYYCIVYKDKRVTYFKEFETKPIQWKKKWKLISFGIIILVIVFLIISFKIMDYSLHH